MKHGIIYPQHQLLVDWAVSFADVAHDEQVRKYTGERYIVHPIEVAKKVMTAKYYNINMVIAAIFHDVIEDTPHDEDKLRMLTECYEQTTTDTDFNLKDTIDLVVELTDVTLRSEGNRSYRKQKDCDRLATISDDAKTIKLADIICNSKSIIREDPEFAKVWMREMATRVEILERGDRILWDEAIVIMDRYYAW
tara:strand:- start:1755 stop:2336 length:582 start_codon:yes stop_codon:yes gene_type:complete